MIIIYIHKFKSNLMGKNILYYNIPTILAKKEKMIGNTKDLLHYVNLYRSKISRNINEFIKRKISKEISSDFSRLFWNAVKTERNFVDTLTELKNMYDTIPSSPTYSKGRTDSRIIQLKRWLNPLKNKNLRYLDVGCSEASITEGIAKALNLKTGDIYGCDIFITEEPGGKVIFSRSTPTTLPYEDNQFDLVTTFQALHHFTHPEIMLSEIHRVLKPGGVYIIREHDVRDDHFGVFLDIVHAIYSVVTSSEQTPESFVSNYESFYHSKEEWSKKYIIPAGFKFGGLIKTNDRFNSYYARYFKG